LQPAPDISLSALCANNAEAWGNAYPHLWRVALGSLLAVLGRLPADAENLAADLLAREIIPGVLQQRTESFQKVASFSALLNLTAAIARNRAIDHLRQRSRRPEETVDELPEPAASGDGAGESPLGDDLLAFVMRQLSPPDPELFHDRFVLGFTTREIAENRGLSHGTVVSRFARALEKLRPLLTAELDMNPPA
jgi:RNA polymerase sigma factor (sigma-70 family)